MSEISRYNMGYDAYGIVGAVRLKHEIDKNGNWVKWEDVEKENAALVEENRKCQMREEKYSKQAQRAFDKVDATQKHCDYMNDANAALIRRWGALKDWIKAEMKIEDDKPTGGSKYWGQDDVLDKMKELDNA